MNLAILLHLAIAIIGIVLLIVIAKVNPVISLVVGALYLGVAGGLGPTDSVVAVSTGFGNLMAEVGLIIGFGVMIGALLSANGTMKRVVDGLLKMGGPKASAYILGLSSGIIFPSIYFDVALVIMAPIAKAIAQRTKRSVAPLAGALAIGLEVGLLMVIPGAAALAMAASLKIDMGTMLLWGIPSGIFLVMSSIFVHTLITDRTWNPAKDEEPGSGYVHVSREEALAADAEVRESVRQGGKLGTDLYGAAEQAREYDVVTAALAEEAAESKDRWDSHQTRLPIIVAMLPILVPILLIIIDTVCRLALGSSPAPIKFLGNPVVALLIGLAIGIVETIPMVTRDGVDEIITQGAQTSGSILLFTGVAGSLGQVITEVGIGDMLAKLFEANAGIPILLAWLVAAILRIAQGSGSVAAMTGASILAPVVVSTGLPPVLILLAASSGAAFGGNVTDNTFWIFKQMLGLTTRGAFQVYTMAQSVLALIGLAFCSALALFF
ncbi:GntP family permease [Luteococcus peritonei]|uniref:GntP family permease n=1 Tax=Luteococcus peritonei TaxID=88874 RepID=A0ABW4RWX0_9ACTN